MLLSSFYVCLGSKKRKLRFHFHEKSLSDSHNAMMLTVIDMSRRKQPAKKKEEPEEEEEEW